MTISLSLPDTQGATLPNKRTAASPSTLHTDSVRTPQRTRHSVFPVGYEQYLVYTTTVPTPNCVNMVGRDTVSIQHTHIFWPKGVIRLFRAAASAQETHNIP